MMREERQPLQAIDIHSHIGPAHGPAAMEPVENGTEEYLLRTMKLAGIRYSVNSSRYAILPRGSGYSAEGNRQLLRTAEREEGVYAWITVDPHEPETFEQARQLIGHPKVVGIKLHPEEHEYQLAEQGERLFSLAAELHAPVLGHSGGPRCLPEVFCRFANRYPEIPIIAAHLGSSPNGDPMLHLRAIEESKYGNLYTDTSSAMSLLSGLLEYAVNRIGSEHILFGSDSGFYFSPCQRLRVDEAMISEKAKYDILYGNASRLFPQFQTETEKE